MWNQEVSFAKGIPSHSCNNSASECHVIYKYFFVHNNIPSCWSVSDRGRSLTVYISIALMIGGSVEFPVLRIEKTYFLPVKGAVLYTVSINKYLGERGPYQSFPFIVILNDLDSLALSFTTSAKCM